MKKLSILISVLSIICITASVSHSAQYWAKTYGGSETDISNSIQQTLDGGYIVAGYTESFDLWILKLNNNGDISWQRKYGGVHHDIANSIQQTLDGGYVVAGYTESFGNNSDDFWVLKLNSDGYITWQKTYGGGSDERDERANCIHQTSDGGYIVAGGTQSFGVAVNDFWVLKLDNGGNITWQKTYGGSDFDVARDLKQTSDGGYIVVGFIGVDLQILKLDDAGNILWKKKYGWGDGIDAYSIQQTSDGGYIVAGEVWTFGDSTNNILVLKLDNAGNIIWQKTYGGNSFDRGYSIQQTSDGGYIVAGSTHSFSAGYDDVWVLKLDSSGDVAWQKTYGGNESDSARSIHQTEDGGYIVAGHTISFGAGSSDFWVLKLDSNGEISDCSISGSSSAIVNDTSIIPQDTSVTIQLTDAIVMDTSVIPQETSAETSIVCSSDIDEDGIQNSEDNCPWIPNGPELGVCYNYPDAGNTCLSTDDCDECCMNQEEYVCECKSDFNCDLNVDASDVGSFLNSFGRSQYFEPCTDLDPCSGDFNCDVSVDADDMRQFLSDFNGRFFCGPSFCLSPCITCIEENYAYTCTYE